MEKGGGQLVDAPSFVDLCTLHQHAMRYYRLWIYACNTVLALATLIFTLFALSIFIDPRISLLSGIQFYQPTFLYAYVALLLQCGVLQAIGCVGAIRLNQKLLNIYWTLLLVLMIGDILVGLVWAFRLDRIKSNLRPHLKKRLSSQYGNDSTFTQTWDWVQTNDMCCGVDGPTDFLQFNESSSSHFDSSLPFEASMGYHPKLPSTCCTFTISQYFPTPPPTTASSGSSVPMKGHPDWADPNRSSTRSNPGETSSQQQQRTNRVNYPHYPNNNFTMHLSSFGSSPGGGTHNRRKITTTKKHLGHRHHDPNQQHPHRSNVQTTTESARRTPYGVCMLPPELLAKYKNNIYIRVSDTIIDNYSFEGSGGASSEEATSSPENVSSSTTTTTTTITTSSSNLKQSGWSSSSPRPSHVSSSTTPSPGGDFSDEMMISSTPPPNILVVMTLNSEGCGDKILEWVDQAADVLFVLGFCIIVFLKGCFVAILRYEIKEMIQKIKLLNGEDNGRMAAMNELIGLTSMYEQVNNDPGEREGLISSTSGASTQGGDATTNTNIDALESDTRKDSVISVRDHHNCVIVGNNVASRKSIVGNHIGSNNTSSVVPNAAGNTPVVHEVLVPNISGFGPGPNFVSPNPHRQDSHDNDEDYDSALLGKKFFRNENGGRTFPRNGNNNTTGLGGVTGSASAPIPIEYMAKA